MASGKKNYFRHSFFARDDIKLRLLRDEVGTGFYFYYFSLLELCGTQCEYESKTQFEFHNSIIRSLWGVNLKKSERTATKMNLVGLLLFEKREKSFYFEIPNFPKYLGKYQNKITPNRPNKRKENKIKENKIKSEFDFEEIYQNYPRRLGKKQGLIKCKAQIKTQGSYEKLKTAVENYKNLTGGQEKKYIKHFSTFMNCWEDYLEKITTSATNGPFSVEQLKALGATDEEIALEMEQ
ncbi:MAG: hypothetical protein ACPG5Z_00380 [Pseudoalteromonas sp.]